MYTICVLEEPGAAMATAVIFISCASTIDILCAEIRKQLALPQNAQLKLYLPGELDNIINGRKRLSEVWTDLAKFEEEKEVILKYSDRAFCCFSILLSA